MNRKYKIYGALDSKTIQTMGMGFVLKCNFVLYQMHHTSYNTIPVLLKVSSLQFVTGVAAMKEIGLWNCKRADQLLDNP